MDKNVLVQYCDIMEEIKYLRAKIKKLDKFLVNPPVVSDTVRGTRRDGTIGPIKITGIPNLEIRKKEGIRERYRQMLENKERELESLLCEAEAYVERIEKAEIRIMFRLYYIEGLSDTKVAEQMNRMYPKRRITYTDENVKKRRQRYFEKIENVPQCPEEI